jgi:hypothetical protein
MPQDRLRSPRGSRGRRLTSLTDFEFRVWDQYQLSADDFGVMRCSPLTVQAENDNLADRPSGDVLAALERMIAVGLVAGFEHQGRRYICQLDWQEFQKVEYPRRTLMPCPPDELLAKCDASTAKLFRQYPGGLNKRKKRKRGGTVPDTSPDTLSDTGADTVPDTSQSERRAFPSPRETANANGLRLTANTGGTVLAGSLPREHLDHTACDDSFAWCVPSRVHLKLLAALSPKHRGDRSAAGDELKAWYPTVWATLPAGFVMGDAFRFWQGRFDAAFATPDAVTAKTPERRSNVPDAEATRRRLQETA